MKDLPRLVPYSEDNGKLEKRSPIISMQNFSSGVSSFFYARLMKKFRWADAAHGPAIDRIPTSRPSLSIVSGSAVTRHGACNGHSKSSLKSGKVYPDVQLPIQNATSLLRWGARSLVFAPLVLVADVFVAILAWYIASPFFGQP
jgi:hypothetical protein